MVKGKIHKHQNPFKEYQKKRIEENRAKIKGAIATLKKARAEITYSAVARFTGMTVSGIRRNSDYVMIIETAKAQTTPHIKASWRPDTENPRTLDDALAIIRIIRAKNRDLRNKLSVHAKVFKRYNMQLRDGECVAVSIDGSANQTNYNKIDALTRVLLSILEDKIYEVTLHGIINSFGELVVPRVLLKATGIEGELDRRANK